ncbi:hypothetical protein N7467_009075 [Penicillium canescens]|nr:hypothetical protein N7467_009075 [Penicillium canescens]
MVYSRIPWRVKERSRAINFDALVNITHRSKSGSRQYDAAFDMVEEVNETIDTIANLCGPFAHPGTCFNGLFVLCNIGKIIALSSKNTVGHEVQKNFQPGYDNRSSIAKAERVGKTIRRLLHF